MKNKGEGGILRFKLCNLPPTILEVTSFMGLKLTVSEMIEAVSAAGLFAGGGIEVSI